MSYGAYGGSAGSTDAAKAERKRMEQEVRATCPKSYLGLWKHGPAEESHVCPYKHDIDDDVETLCGCCERCTQECADDV